MKCRILIVLCLLFWASSAFATVTIGSSGSAKTIDGTPGGLSGLTVNTTGAKAIIIAGVADDPCTFRPVDSLGNTFTALAGSPYHHPDTMNLWWYLATSNSLNTGSDTFTVFDDGTHCTGYYAMAVAAVNFSSPTDGNTFLAAQSSTTAGALTLQVGPNSGGAIVFSAIATAVSGTTLTIDSSFTILQQQTPTSAAQGIGLAYRLNPGTTSPTWTLSASGAAVASIASFDEKLSTCGGSHPNWIAVDWAHVAICHGLASDGDTITVTAGTYGVSSTTYITKAVTIQSAGAPHNDVTGNSVTLTDNTCSGLCTTDGIIVFTESTVNHQRLYNIKIVQGTGAYTAPGSVIRIAPTSGGKAVVIYGMDYVPYDGRANFILDKSPRGVFAYNQITGIPNGSNCFDIVSFLKTGFGDYTSFPRNATMGTADTDGEQNLYIEHNTFNNAAEAVDIDDNERAVFRHNVFKSSAIIYHGDTSVPGGRHFEIYSNQFIRDDGAQANCIPPESLVNFASFIGLRAGVGMIYNNTPLDTPANAWFNQGVAIKLSALALNSMNAQYRCWNKLTQPGAGWPIPYQTGWGYIEGATHTPVGTTGVLQDRESIYIWGNTGSGNYNSPSPDDFPNANDLTSCWFAHPELRPFDVASSYIQNNREYYLQNSSTDTAHGVTVATDRTGRSSICTAGVAWWNTSLNVLDKCTATNTWTNNFYTPYGDPHPLVPTGGTPDTTPPTVSITTPTSGANIATTLNASATAADNVAVANVVFRLDGTAIGSAITTPPYNLSYSLSGVSLGSHALTAVATDTASNSTTSSVVNFNVVAPTDTTPPTVSITSPLGGANIGATLNASATASDNVAVASVVFKLDGTQIGSPITTPPYNLSYSMSGVSIGAHTLTAMATDTSSNSTTSSPVNINALDTIPPVISITSPTNGANISPPLNASATASDNVGVASVTFKLDATTIGSPITTPPYNLSYSLSGVSLGAHVLTAVATDAASNATVSTAVNINVISSVTITTPAGALPAAETGYSYSFTLSASGGTGPYTWSIASGSLPNGLTLAPSTGIISGTPSSEVTGLGVDVVATDTLSHPSAPVHLQMTVYTGVAITTLSPLPQATTGTIYTTTLAGTGGVPPFAWSTSGGTVPPGLTLASNGVLSGTPSTAGAYNFTAQLRDSLFVYVSSRAFDISVRLPIDSTPPTVTVTSPTNGTTVTGTLNATADATDNIGVASVQFTLDGNPIGAPDTVGPFTLTYNISGVAPGPHVLRAVASDAANNSTISTGVNINVVAPTDTTPPVVTITAPIPYEPLFNQFVAKATATDSVGVVSVQWKLDGTPIGPAQTIAPYTLVWDITNTSIGLHTLTAEAKDPAGNVGQASIVIMVDP